eukprot:364295-Chlamydomonas_euryale.AAC.2
MLGYVMHSVWIVARHKDSWTPKQSCRPTDAAAGSSQGRVCSRAPPGGHGPDAGRAPCREGALPGGLAGPARRARTGCREGADQVPGTPELGDDGAVLLHPALLPAQSPLHLATTPAPSPLFTKQPRQPPLPFSPSNHASPLSPLHLATTPAPSPLFTKVGTRCWIAGPALLPAHSPSGPAPGPAC